MQPQRPQDDPTAANFLICRHSGTVDTSRRRDGVEGRSFAVQPTSAFHDYDKQQQFLGHYTACNQETAQNHHQQTGDVTEDDGDFNSRSGGDRGVVADDFDDGMRPSDGCSERKLGDTARDVAVGHPGGPVGCQTPKKHDYSVAELLRNDRPSSSATYDQHTGPTLDIGQRDEARTSPSQTADRTFCHGWRNAVNVDRPLPPPPFAVDHHRWAEWLVSDSCRRRAELIDDNRRQCFDLLNAPPPASFVAKHPARDTRLQLPFSWTIFGQQCAIPRRSRYCQLLRTCTYEHAHIRLSCNR